MDPFYDPRADSQYWVMVFVPGVLNGLLSENRDIIISGFELNASIT